MRNPNSLGHWHRKAVKEVSRRPYWVTLKLTCGHLTETSIHAMKKYGDGYFLCVECERPVRVIVDTRDASQDYELPAGRAIDLFELGELKKDLTNMAYSDSRKRFWQERIKP